MLEKAGFMHARRKIGTKSCHEVPLAHSPTFRHPGNSLFKRTHKYRGFDGCRLTIGDYCPSANTDAESLVGSLPERLHVLCAELARCGNC